MALIDIGKTKTAVEQESALRPNRRAFIGWLLFGWSAFVAALLTLSAGTFRTMFPNVLFEPPQTFKAGYPFDFRVGEVDERFKSKWGVWIIRDQGGLYALLAVCTHLGCTPNWLPEEEKFKCPCHGSGFYVTGINFEGPAPRPLERLSIRLGDDGQIVIDKNIHYHYEKGEWSEPDAYLRV